MIGKKISLMKWRDSNMAGYEWVINVVLTQRKNKLFSIRAIQVAEEPPTYKTPLIYPIKNGYDLMTSIKKVFQDDLVSHISIDWVEILKNLNESFPEIHNELVIALKNTAENDD